jgi:ATP-dependent RNA helicase DeaD
MKAIRRRIVSSVTATLPETMLMPDAADSDTARSSAVYNSDTVVDSNTASASAAVSDVSDSNAVSADVAVSDIPDSNAAPVPAGIPAGIENRSSPLGDDSISPFLAKVCRQLIEQLGAEQALAALVSLTYGELLDPSRYGTITEFSEEDFREPGRFAGRQSAGRHSAKRFNDRGPRMGGALRSEGHGFAPRGGKRGGGSFSDNSGKDFAAVNSGVTRVYVGLGRRHGATARDVAGLLMRAGGVPGRLVDAIEMRDYCAFANLPADAARRACVFSKNTPDDPAIKPASEPKG